MGENPMCKRHWLSTLVLAGMIAAVPLLERQTMAQQPAEQQLMDLVNADRAQQGLPPLKWDPALAQAAMQHAQLMAQQQSLSHQYPGEPDLDARCGAAGAHFRAIAENVALAPSPQALNQEWMHSPPHRANILDPRMDTIGVGLVRQGGNYYAVEDFASTVANLGPEQVEQKIGQLLQQRGLQSAGLTPEARQTCQMDHGSAGGPKPWFIMRWEGTDLSRLPDELEQRISTGKYHKAAVGACGNPGQGFTTYKIAVMLYQ
jgi:Cysteine-rich secretory protein family